MKIIKYLILCLIFIILGCYNKIIILATKDATLLSNHQKINFSGKKIISQQLGYQTVKYNKKGKITYPALYIGSNNLDSIKDSFVIGGFDFKNIDKNFKKARLKFFINYSSFTRKNITIFIRPLKKEWDEDKITYSDIYKNVDNEIKLTDMVEDNEKNCKLILFSVEQTLDKDYYEIPFSKKGKEISINITDIVKEWIDNPYSNYGLLIDPMVMSDLRYKTTNESREVCATGTIEIASSEWFYWEPNFEKEFLNIKNNAKNNIKYVPRIELEY